MVGCIVLICWVFCCMCWWRFGVGVCMWFVDGMGIIDKIDS